MVEIKDLLSRFNNLLLSEEEKINSIRSVLFKTINLKIEPKNIKIKNNIIYLNIKPIYKNEILIKKEQIFIEFKEILGRKSPADVL